MHSPESNIPLTVQTLLAISVAGIVMVTGSSFTLWFSKRQIMQVQNHIRRVEEKSKKVSAEAEKLSDKVDVQKEQSKKLTNELRLYRPARISDLQRELSLWRDTARKMLYNSQNEFQIADKIIDVVMPTLKTYTMRGHSDDNMDEMLHLAQLIADSRELHSKHDSTNSQNDT